ncbi:MAG: ammonia-forming cytochrome c nitrite reductase subunit c552 [bacterium]
MAKTRYFLIAVIVAFSLFFLHQETRAQSTYVGTETCNNCHGKEANFAGNQWATWVKTRHNMKWRDPDEGLGVVAHDYFVNNLDLSTDPDFAAFGANAPKLSFDPSDPADSTDGKSGYRVTVGATTYEVNWTLGGTGVWKQRYMTEIGNSIYILPIQYNETTDDWVPYHPPTWYDSNNQPLAEVPKADSYQRRCIGCHSVNPVVSFNDSTGEWTATVTERNIGCEDCHGPGSEHAQTTDKTKIINPETDLTNKDRRLEVCGACHGRGSSTATLGGKNFGFPYNDANGHYRPGEVLADYYNQTTSSSNFWPNEQPYGRNSKSHHQQYLDFLTSAHYSNPFEEINCWTCHDPHGGTGQEFLIRDKLVEDGVEIATTNDDNTLCLACHAEFEPFDLISKEMVADPTGANLETIKAVVETHTKHPYDPTGTGASRCTKCHDPKVAKSAIEYDIHSHSFWVMSPEQTLTYQPEGGVPNSCAVSCHRKAEFPNFGMDLSGDVLKTWTESTDIALADTLQRFLGAGGYWWDTDPSGNMGDPLLVKRVDTMPTIDGDDSDAAWAGAQETTLANGATIKAVNNSDMVAFLVKWSDPTMSMTRGGSWQWVSGAWVKTNATEEGGANEDRFNILWNINISEFGQRGCATKCHGQEGNATGAYLDKVGEYADMWHMKASRALPAISSSQSDNLTFSTSDATDQHQVTSGTIILNGYADDKLTAARLDPAYPFDPEDGGRHGDSGTAMFRHNRNSDKTAPMYIETAPTNYIDGMVLYQSEIDNGEAVEVASLSTQQIDQAWAAYAAVNAVVPERIMQQPAGSRGDVREAAKWENGQWTAEYERALVTNNVDDVQFDDLTKGYLFGTSIMDNSGGDKHNISARLNELRFDEFVGIETPGADNLPSQYALLQNYPNPFNPTTKIRFTLRKSGLVKLRVFNMLGQQVKTLVYQQLPAGQYEVPFDASQFSSGLYLYRLEVNGFTQVKKMVLAK